MTSVGVLRLSIVSAIQLLACGQLVAPSPPQDLDTDTIPGPTDEPTKAPTDSPTFISSFDTWTGGPVTFSVWIHEAKAYHDEPKEYDCFDQQTFSSAESCKPDVWCRIQLPDGGEVRTETVSDDINPSWDESEALTVTLDQNDYLDVKCWDADGDGDQESLGWKHIPATNFFPCGMGTQEFSLKLSLSGFLWSSGYDVYDNKVVLSVAPENPDVQEWCAAYQEILANIHIPNWR